MVSSCRVVPGPFIFPDLEDPVGSKHVQIGVCCSGGRHRSVACEFLLSSIPEIYACSAMVRQSRPGIGDLQTGQIKQCAELAVGDVEAETQKCFLLNYITSVILSGVCCERPRMGEVPEASYPKP